MPIRAYDILQHERLIHYVGNVNSDNILREDHKPHGLAKKFKPRANAHLCLLEQQSKDDACGGQRGL